MRSVICARCRKVRPSNPCAKCARVVIAERSAAQDAAEPWREVYRDPRWQSARQECIRRADGQCTYGLELGERYASVTGRCPVTRGLQAHHRTSLAEGGAAFEQENLRCLCATHHRRLEGRRG